MGIDQAGGESEVGAEESPRAATADRQVIMQMRRNRKRPPRSKGARP